MTHKCGWGETGARKRARLILLLGVMICCVAGLWSQTIENQSEFVFPRIAVSARTDTGIVLFNPSAKDASVSLSLTQSEGPAVAVTVPALGQFTGTAVQLFGSADFSGSLQIGSPTAGLVAYYETFDLDGTFMDGADAPASSLNLIFPVMPDGTPERTEITLLNSTVRNTLVQLKLWNRSGDALGEAIVQVPATSTFRNSLSSIFPSVADFAGASHIAATSKPVSLIFEPQPVSGTSLFADGGSDIAALNALTPTQLFTSGAIPYFRVGPKHFSTLSLANYEPAAIDVTVTAVGNDGATVGSRKVTIPGNGGLRQSLQSLFPVPDGQSGWILLQGTGRFAANLLHGRSDAGAFSAVAMQKDARTRFVFPQIVQGFGYSSEISLANPGPNESTVELFVITPGGVTVARNKVVLAPSRRISQTLDKYMPEVKEFPGGAVFVQASQPVFATRLGLDRFRQHRSGFRAPAGSRFLRAGAAQDLRGHRHCDLE